MELINIAELDSYVSIPVQLAIHDENGTKAPWTKKIIEQVTLCPDGTHLRLYFDQHHFLAIPRMSQVVKDDRLWIAHDEKNKLIYMIRKEETFHE
ncbi:hypothetical protein AC623_10245 [Bacillus sp. FJAT-27231]|uniref:hypothetical protein n=1 Tax=Bacillus sp. FJAT-27231 TaxID=1679168 RepID=UPI000671713F|nr:hypothetical protein [Bacillus sp. FJAT-27231]KMY54267.1 hypothetical protein AC623_10245 [Bacillus sp. FJAT-27231]